MWDGIKRRSEDNGGESPEVILARIDERVKNMNQKLDSHVDTFKTHVEEDKGSFKIIRDQVGKHAIFIYMALGGLAVIKFLFNK